jgi:hypothetical protein
MSVRCALGARRAERAFCFQPVLLLKVLILMNCAILQANKGKKIRARGDQPLTVTEAST